MLEQLLADQAGLISRAQLLSVGGRHDLDRLVRRRELTRVHPRVFVNHTGPLSDEQRAWAAVLYAGGPGQAALYLGSALPDPDGDAPVHVAIDESRRVPSLPAVRVHRVLRLAPLVRWNVSPPRVRVEPNTLELVHRAATEMDVVRLLTDACNGRHTHPQRLRPALAERKRMRRRPFVAALLDDIEAGACSVLEEAYLTRVERAHRLPEGRRQVRREGERGTEYRDVEYAEFGVEVELDGRTGHLGWDKEGRDADRDLDDLTAGRVTARVRWAQVFQRECQTAERIGRLLARRGWTGRPQPCGPTCTLRVAA